MDISQFARPRKLTEFPAEKAGFTEAEHAELSAAISPPEAVPTVEAEPAAETVVDAVEVVAEIDRDDAIARRADELNKACNEAVDLFARKPGEATKDTAATLASLFRIAAELSLLIRLTRV